MGLGKKVSGIFPEHKWMILGLAIGMVLAHMLWFPLPDPLFEDPLCPILLSREGNIAAVRISGDHQWRFPTIDFLPDKYEKALLYFEDKRFYYHPGIDPVAIARALWLNLAKGRRVSGGSTISMQVVRMALKHRQRSLAHKMMEMILALKLEMKYSKQKILRFYAANAPFGGNIVGLGAASHFYFRRKPAELSWAEAACLAVLPNRPDLIHPGRNRRLLRQKRDGLLNKLWQQKIMSDLDYRLAIREPVPTRLKSIPRLATHLLDSLTQKSQAGQGRRLFHSTIQWQLQDQVGRICREYGKNIRCKGIRNCAALVIDNRRAEVVAYVGNVGLTRKRAEGQSVDIVQAQRSTGSLLKPILYAAMLREGSITPNMLIADIPTHYTGFTPDNFDGKFRGAVTAKSALTMSLNIPCVRLLRKYGYGRFYHLLKQCGLSSLFRPASRYGLSLIVGGAEGSLMELTSMYAKMAQLANIHQPRVNKIRLIKGEKKEDISFSRHIGRGSAYMTLQALRYVSRPGLEGFWRNFNSSRIVAWKTGTSFGFRDGWAIGVTPKYTVGVWTGNASGEGNAVLTGHNVAAPLMFAIFNILETGHWFTKPQLHLKKVKICRHSGHLPSRLCPTRTIDLPIESHFSSLCPYHHLVHLDQSGCFQVDSRLESVHNMIHKPWFSLPPIQAYYFQKIQPDYRPLPPWRPDYVRKYVRRGKIPTMCLRYPENNTTIYVPIDLNGRLSSTIFRAVHNQPENLIYWHLDGRYLTTTQTFHEISIAPDPGQHILLLVDQTGNQIKRTFRVIGK